MAVLLAVVDSPASETAAVDVSGPVADLSIVATTVNVALPPAASVTWLFRLPAPITGPDEPDE